MKRPQRKDCEINRAAADAETAKGIHHFSFEQHKYTDQLESELKEKDIIISEYHTKMLADKESYFGVVEAHDDLEAKLKEQCIINLSLSEQADEFRGKLIESIEALLILVDSKLSILDVHEIGQEKNHVWNKVVEIAQELVKQK